MDEKNRNIPELVSRVTLSMVLTASLVLNGGYTTATAVQDVTDDKTVTVKGTTSTSNSTSTLKGNVSAEEESNSTSEEKKVENNLSENTTSSEAVISKNKKDNKISVGGVIETSIYDFEYKLSDNDEVIITKYIGSDKEVVIPEDFNGYYVTEISNGAFNSSSITSVTLSSTVEKIGNSAFYYCTQLKTVNLNDGLKEIGSSAFQHCYYLESIKIPDSCKTIGAYAFYDNYRMTTLDLGNGVESIGNSAFRYCYKIESIKIPDSVTSMGSYVFDRNEAVTEITIGKGLKSIPYCTFGSNYSVTSVTMPDSIETIEDYAFGNCRKLNEINWSANLKTIGKYAFEYNYALTEFTIPDTVTSIGYEALRYCTALTTINLGKNVSDFSVETITGDTALTTINAHKDNTYFSNDSNGVLFNKDKTTLIRMGRGYEGTYTIPSTVTKIGRYAFSYCQKLSEIEISDNVEEVDEYAFQYCNLITSISFSDNLKKINNHSFRDCYKLETVNLGKSIESIGNYAFHNCDAIQSITLPDTCTTLGEYSFYDCDALSEFNLGKGVTSIGSYAYHSCDKLKSIEFPDSLKTISNYAFQYSGLENVKIPNSVENMGIGVFGSCSSLKTVSIGKGITTIPNYTFSNCTSLDNVEIPANITSIGYQAFYTCKSMQNLTLNEGLTSISNYAFQYCSSLTSVVLPESVTTVDYNAFEYCTSLESFYAGKSLNYLPVSVFYGDTSLKEITISQENEKFCSVDGVMFNKDCTQILVFPHAKEGKYTIPNTVEKINDNAFNGALYITEVTLGNSVKSVGNSAFIYCKALEKIVINDDCESIGDSAFNGCTALKSVVLGKNTKTVGSYGFYSCTALKSVVLGENTKTIGNHCFRDCTALEEIDFGNTLSSISYQAFLNCKSLKSIEIPDSVKSIDSYAFEYCYALESVDFGNGVESIGYESFYRTNISTVVIPDSVKSINSYVFSYTPLKSIHIGSSLTSIEIYNNFPNTIEEITVSEENTKFTVADNILYNKDMTELIYCCRTREGEIVIPGTVTTLGNYAFYNCSKITSIKEYGNVLSAGSYAVNNLDKNNFTAYVIENSYLHKTFSGKGYTCETIEDTRTQINDCKITYDEYVKYAYSAKANLKIYDNEKELVEDKDYKAYYSNSGYYSTGVATITIYGMGEYGGNTSVQFTIYNTLGSSFDVKRTGAGTYTFKSTASNGVADYKYTFEFTPAENSNSENAQWTEIPNPDNLSTLSYFFEEDGEFTVRATVTDAIGNTSVNKQNVTVTAPRAKMTFSNENPKFGDSITITGYGNNFGKNKQYQFEYKEENSDEWTIISEFGTNREINFSFNNSGTYQIRLRIKDDAENTAEKIQSFTIIKPVLEVSTNKTPVLNEEFYIVSDIENLINEYSYKYEYRKSGDTNWTTIKSFTSENKYPFKLTQTGTYQLRVTARYNKDTSIKSTKVKSVTIKKPVVTLTAPETSEIGSTEQLKASSNYFGDSVTYKYQYKSVTDTQWRNLYNGTDLSTSIKLQQTGNYTVRVIATDDSGNKSTSTKTISVTGATIELVADNPKVYVGENINLTAKFKNFTGDTSDYTYKFEYRECLSSTWHTLQDYSKSSTAVFTTKQCATSDQYASYAGMYELRVTSKDKNGTTSVSNIDVLVKKMELTFALSETNVVPNTEVTLSAFVNGGVKPVKFMFEFKKDNGEWQPLVYSDYTEKNILKFKFSAEGVYSIRASAKDNNGLTIGNTTDSSGVGYEGQILKLSVKNPVVHTLESTLSTNNNSLSIGQNCTLTANSQYATGTAQYKFTVKSSSDSTEKLLQDFSSNNKLSFAGDKEGTYTITAYVKDDSENVSKSEVKVTVRDYILNISSDRSSVTSGREFNISSRISYSAQDTYKYKYEYKLKGDSNWKTVSDFSENTSQTFKLFTVGVYDVRVTAQNSAGIEKVATTSITVNEKLNCVISAMPTHIATNSDTIIICNSTGGTGNVTYKYEYCLTGTGVWYEFYNSGNGAVTTFSADTAGVYKIRATATDSTGATKRTDFIKVYVQ